ncbi:MAG: LytTR family DNA-binding domain-containing protein, partial [Pseudomonadota bacterium]
GFIEIGLRCLPISIGITAVYTLLTISTRPAAQSPQHAPAMQPPAPFLKRLSPETGTVITTLQAQDHYVEVTTTRGQELVLIRLGDAQKELSGLDGMRVHRSWWVARAAIQSTARDNGRLTLILTDGRKIPVSRSNEKDVRQWLENRLP